MALEDVLGGAAVIDELGKLAEKLHLTSVAERALAIFKAIDGPLSEVLRRTRGGQNILAAGLDADIDFAARVNAINVVGVARGDPLAVFSSPSGRG
jgi:phosphosulfolactate phosphohydrolase-like enzyme